MDQLSQEERYPIYQIRKATAMPKKFPVTPAIRFLEENGVEFIRHLYDYTKSGAVFAAEQMGINEHQVIKTLVMEDGEGKPFIVLMHAENQASLKELARQLGVKNVKSTSKKDAQRHTGYMVGGISPFGTKRQLPIIVERTILELSTLYINAGRRGFIVELNPQELVRVLKPTLVNVAR